MTTLDENKLNAFVNQLVGDIGATLSSVLVLIGDRLGLWKTMAASGPITSTELAKRSECSERYIFEWLNAQAASGYVTYDPKTRQYALSPENAVALADETSPFFFGGAFEIAGAAWAAVDKATQNFRTGQGMEWGSHHPCLFQGTERFFRSSYIGHLVADWLPALDGVVEKLKAGALVADVGCGVGASTILMAKAFPKSRFRAFDSHAGSIELAKKRAEAAGVGLQISFEVAKSTDFPGEDYDLVCNFDSLHDMEDPAGCAKHTRKVLKPGGTWMIVEPAAHDHPEHNHNMIGRTYYSSSTLLCVPHSLSQGGPALGAQAGEKRLREVIGAGGFGQNQIRRAKDTAFNMVLEAKR